MLPRASREVDWENFINFFPQQNLLVLRFVHTSMLRSMWAIWINLDSTNYAFNQKRFPEL